MLFEHPIFRQVTSLFVSTASLEFKKVVLQRKKSLTQGEMCKLIENEDDELMKSEIELVEEVPALVQELQDIESLDQVD